MPNRSPRLLSLAAALTITGGCAAEGDFPSLAPRAVERTLGSEEPVRALPAVAADPQLSARIAKLLTGARRGQREFEAALPAANAAVSRAGEAGSEGWIDAQQAISRLEAARALTVTALGQLDALAVERANQPTNAANFASLVEAVETAVRLAERQQAVIDRLRASLSPL